MLTVGAGSVQVHECDAMGHMNVRFYVARATDALASLAITVGLGPRFARAQHAYLAMAEAHIRFVGEMRPGTPFVFQGGILQTGERPRLYLEMRDVATNRVAATFAIVAALVDSQTAGWRAVPPLEGTIDTISLPDYATPRAGDVLAIRAGLRAVSAKTMNPVNWLFDRETGEAVATAESVIVGFDRQTRKAVEMSETARRALERHVTPGL